MNARTAVSQGSPYISTVKANILSAPVGVWVKYGKCVENPWKAVT